MAIRRRRASTGTATATKAKPKAKKAYTDGKLEFGSKPLLDYHIRLKELKATGVIRNFEVPTISQKVKNKHGAIKIMIDDYLFDSKVESNYYLYLLNEKANGNIKSFSLQPTYELQPRFQKVINGKKKTFRPIDYIADFLVIDNNNEEVVIDIKGQLTDVFKLKHKLFEYKFPDKTLVLIKEVRGQWVTL